MIGEDFSEVTGQKLIAAQALIDVGSYTAASGLDRA
ncbi:unannotated protein [freshwater metagenome]|uniref:Unannotated protein n=1 Tax=freshwater metagenome TaxID=449393 RepID=A0A6J6PKV1_9ZZZZ